jgi:hypothetical protein
MQKRFLFRQSRALEPLVSCFYTKKPTNPRTIQNTREIASRGRATVDAREQDNVNNDAQPLRAFASGKRPFIGKVLILNVAYEKLETRR